MKRHLSVWLVLLGLTLSACGNACKDLADKACERAGDDAKVCIEARARAEKAGPQERDMCATALELYSLAGEPR